MACAAAPTAEALVAMMYKSQAPASATLAELWIPRTRRSPAQWEQAGAHDLRTVARQRTLDLLATYFPRHLDSETEAALRAAWDIKLLPQEMHAP